jgi:hypothetical protein
MDLIERTIEGIHKDFKVAVMNGVGVRQDLSLKTYIHVAAMISLRHIPLCNTQLGILYRAWPCMQRWTDVIDENHWFFQTFSLPFNPENVQRAALTEAMINEMVGLERDSALLNLVEGGAALLVRVSPDAIHTHLTYLNYERENARGPGHESAQ